MHVRGLLTGRCPCGWAYYADFSGQEGNDSCIYVSKTTVTSWVAASAGCPAGSHLLTFRGAATGGLLQYASSLVHGGGFPYIGCMYVFWLWLTCLCFRMHALKGLGLPPACHSGLRLCQSFSHTLLFVVTWRKVTVTGGALYACM
jgi:hypothetical protein